MAWSSAFLNALKQRSTSMAFRIEVTPDGAKLTSGAGQFPVVTAPDGLTPTGYQWLDNDLRVSGLGLSLRTWQQSAGRLTFRVHCNRDRAEAILAVWREGDVVSLYGTAGSYSERIWLGRLQDMVWQSDGRGGAVLECLAFDAVTLLQSGLRSGGWPDRLFGWIESMSPVFSGTIPGTLTGVLRVAIDAVNEQVSGATLTTAIFNPGVSTTLDVVDVGDLRLGYNHQTGTPEGACLVQPTAGGPPFVVRYDTINSGANRLEGLSYTVTGAPNPPYVACGSGGATVVPLAWQHGHPYDILLAGYTSTGAGTNGLWDVLDADQGIGLPVDFFDTSDITTRRLHVVTSAGTHARYQLFSEKSQDGGTFFSKWASPLGVWPIHRQGQVTFRCAIDPHDSIFSSAFVMDITDDDIIGIGAQGQRAPGMPVEVGEIKLMSQDWQGAATYGGQVGWVHVAGTGGGAGSAPRTSPKIESMNYDLTRQIMVGLFGLLENDIERRIAPWWSRIAAHAFVELRSSALHLCAGDAVRVTHYALMGPNRAFGITDEPAIFIPSEQVWGIGGGGVRGVRGVLLFLPDL